MTTRAPRREGVWIPVNNVVTAPAAAAQSQSSDMLSAFVGDAGRELGRNETIVRIRGLLNIVSALTAAREEWMVAMVVITEGQTFTPSLSSELFDAIYRTAGKTSGEVTELAAGVFQNVSELIPVDSKAMRKLRGRGDELVMVTLAGAAAAMTFSFSGSIYVKLG